MFPCCRLLVAEASCCRRTFLWSLVVQRCHWEWCSGATDCWTFPTLYRLVFANSSRYRLVQILYTAVFTDFLVNQLVLAEIWSFKFVSHGLSAYFTWLQLGLYFFRLGSSVFFHISHIVLVFCLQVGLCAIFLAPCLLNLSHCLLHQAFACLWLWEKWM